MTALRDALSHWRHEMIRTTGLDAATIEGYAADAGTGETHQADQRQSQTMIAGDEPSGFAAHRVPLRTL